MQPGPYVNTLGRKLMAYGAFGHGETNGRTSGVRATGDPAVVLARSAWNLPMESFLVSISTVAIAEMGDRTQLLSLMLAAHYRRPWPILAGVLCATLANHAAAGIIGARLGRILTPTILDAIVGISMIAMALWTLKPDTLGENARQVSRTSAFIATLLAFFVAEIGDKTQIATVALAAAYSNLLAVVGGTTLGMLLANAPVVFLGKAFSDRLPLKRIHQVASGLFLLLGALFIFRALHHTP